MIIAVTAQEWTVRRMRLFKKHKAKDKLVFNFGIKECSTCDMNLRCEECVYQKENENIKSEIEMLEIENQSLRAAANSYKMHYNEAKFEGIKEFAERLKSSIYINTNLLVYQCEAVESMIDDIVKDMVGETNDI